VLRRQVHHLEAMRDKRGQGGVHGRTLRLDRGREVYKPTSTATATAGPEAGTEAAAADSRGVG
jgi:hypothetical protein